MVVITPEISLVFFILTLIVSAILAWSYGNQGSYDKSVLSSFVRIVSGISVIVTFMFYYSVVELSQQQRKLTVIHETSRIDTDITNQVLESINKYSADIPAFVWSLHPLHQETAVIPPDPLTAKTCAARVALSHKIFAAWQEAMSSKHFTDFDTQAYLTTFLQQASSPLLREEWLKSSLKYNSKTRLFGNLLFEYGMQESSKKEISEKIRWYSEQAQKMCLDSRYPEVQKWALNSKYR